jgi:Clp protease
MLMLHDPSGLVMGTAPDMRAMAEALDRMKASMVFAYRDKSSRTEPEIEALMAAETWLSAKEALELGLADRIEQPVRMAAHFDLSSFRNPPPQLAALIATPSPPEVDMSDSKKARPPRPDAATNAAATEESPERIVAAEGDQRAEAAEPAPAPPAADDPLQVTAVAPAAASANPVSPVAHPTAQVIDLDAIRADERKATLAYVAEVHELCALAGRGDLAAGFIAKATPVAQVRRALLEARAAEDEATAIRSQVRPATVEPAPAIDTAAIYAARNQNVR